MEVDEMLRWRKTERADGVGADLMRLMMGVDVGFSRQKMMVG